MIKSEKTELQRFSQFAIVGILNTLIDLGFFNIFLSLGVSPTASSGVSFVIANLNGYILNRHWTFNDRKSERAIPQYGVYLLTNLVGLLVNILVVHFVLAANLSLPTTLVANLAKLLAIGVTVIWNYGVSRLWVFRRPVK